MKKKDFLDRLHEFVQLFDKRNPITLCGVCPGTFDFICKGEFKDSHRSGPVDKYNCVYPHLRLYSPCYWCTELMESIDSTGYELCPCTFHTPELALEKARRVLKEHHYVVD